MKPNYADFLKKSAQQRAKIMRLRAIDQKTGKPRFTERAIADQLQISCQRVHQIIKLERDKKAVSP